MKRYRLKLFIFFQTFWRLLNIHLEPLLQEQCAQDEYSKSAQKFKKSHNLSYGLISPILRDFSISSQPFCLEKDRLALPFGKNTENLRELSPGNKQNKPITQVNKELLAGIAS